MRYTQPLLHPSPSPFPSREGEVKQIPFSMAAYPAAAKVKSAICHFCAFVGEPPCLCRITRSVCTVWAPFSSGRTHGSAPTKTITMENFLGFCSRERFITVPVPGYLLLRLEKE